MSIKLFFAIILFVGCVRAGDENKESDLVTSSPFGVLPDGRAVTLYTLRNHHDATVGISTLGAAIVFINVPDRRGRMGDVLFGHDDAAGYQADNSFLGFIVGRYGNRIAKGKFTLDGKDYQLDINDGVNHLHGGRNGIYRKLWQATVDSAAASVTLRTVSPDGEMGYPGTVTLDVTYTWNDDNELIISYSGTTDAPTILNPTSHGYFNLSGDPSTTILDHRLMIDADSITPVGPGLIPTGKLESVVGTPFDFRQPHRIGERINDTNGQLALGKGYDHNWVLNGNAGTVRRVATLYDPTSGRLMEMLTDQPGLQFYSGNFLDGTLKGKNGAVYRYRTALCLEAQHFPDSPNQPSFPSVVLRPGQRYTQTTIYRFSIQ